MKKIKFLAMTAAVVLGVAAANAQDNGTVDGTFVFLDADGNEVTDGSTVTFYVVTEETVPGVPIFGTTTEAKFDLYVKNTTGEDAAVAARIITERISNGGVQFCFPNKCQSGDLPADYTSDCRILVAGKSLSLNSEWLPVEGSYGDALFTIQLLLVDRIDNDNFTVKAYGPKITVHCIYADPTGIAGLEADKNATETARYDAGGRKLEAPQKGLNIIKLADGKTRKVVVGGN